MRLCHGLGALLLSCSPCVLAVPPVLFSEPTHESPVRGDPGDLLLLAGDAFASTDTVVYQAMADTTQPLAAPSDLPATTDASGGIAPIVSSAAVPYSLTVALPKAMQRDTSYALWVRNESGEWSNGAQINDARPLWITPDTVYRSARIASLPRVLRIVGRNLQPAPGAITQVRLRGPKRFTLPAISARDRAAVIDQYVARVTLPTNLPPGSYAIELSRDGNSWIPITDQTLTVFPDPVPAPEFYVGDYGGCLPDDGVDDTACIAAAIAAALSIGGGDVTFGPGVWDMNYTGALNTGRHRSPRWRLADSGVSATS